MASTSLLVDYENIGKIDLAAIPAGVSVRFFFGASQKTVRTEFLMAALKLGERFVLTEISGQGPNALDFHIAYYLGEILAHDAGERCVVLSKDKGFDPLVKHLLGRGFDVSRAPTLAEVFGATHSARATSAPAPDPARAVTPSTRRAGSARAAAAPKPAPSARSAPRGRGKTARALASAPASASAGAAAAVSAASTGSANAYDKALRRLAGMAEGKRPHRRRGLVAELHSHFARRLSEPEVGALVDRLVEDGKLTETAGVIGYRF